MLKNFVFLLAITLLVACAPVVTDDMQNDTNMTDEPELPEIEEEEEQEEEEPEEEPEAKFTVEGTEGDLIVLEPEAIDPDDDDLTYTFTEPFNDFGEWQTVVGDEGTYFVAVTADDSRGGRTTETVQVIVLRANRAPVIDCGEVRVSEGDLIDLHDNCVISDEDNEEVIVTYGGWMTSWRYQTTYDDAGEHVVVITASDKIRDEIVHTVREELTISVQDVNRPPVFGDFPDTIDATEGDIITLPTDVITDPDGDAVTVTFSDPFDDDGVWATEKGDAGTYDVDVVASDGETTEKRTVTITLELLNTAPVLETIGSITVDEGDLVVLPISATDREGDILTVTISGWMNSEEYQTTYDDAGVYTTKVSVTDGTFVTEEVVTITVNDKNRPPVFVTPA